MKRIIVSLMIALCLIRVVSQEATAAEEKALVLTQKSGLNGVVTIFLSPHAVRINDRTTVLVSKAPSWEVNVFNRGSRSIFKSPLADFKGYSQSGYAAMMRYKLPPVPLRKTDQHTVVFNRPADLYSTTKGFSNTRRAQFKAEELPGSAIFSAQGTAASGNWKLPKEEATVLCRYHSIADIDELPLKYVCKDLDGDNHNALDTLKVVEQTLAVAAFDVPQGYKKVRTIESVRLDQAGTDGMNSLLDGLDSNLRR